MVHLGTCWGCHAHSPYSQLSVCLSHLLGKSAPRSLKEHTAAPPGQFLNDRNSEFTTDAMCLPACFATGVLRAHLSWYC